MTFVFVLVDVQLENCAGNFSGTKKTEEIMVARGSMLELLRIDPDTDKLVSSLALACETKSDVRLHVPPLRQAGLWPQPQPVLLASLARAAFLTGYSTVCTK